MTTFTHFKHAYNEDCKVIFSKPSSQVKDLILSINNDTEPSNISIISTTNISNYISTAV